MTAGNGITVTNNTNAVSVNGGFIGQTNDPARIGVDINGGSGNVTITSTITRLPPAT